MLRGMLAAGLTLAATSLVMAVGPAAQADRRAPYARALATVDAGGTLISGKNVIRSWRAGLGRYCVQVSHHVDVNDALMQVSSRQALRLAHVVYGSTSPVYGSTSPVYRNDSPVYRNTSADHRNDSADYRNDSSVYRNPSPGHRNGSPVYRNPGHRNGWHKHGWPGHRHPSPVYGSPWATCGQHNTVTVNVYNPSTGHLADGGFDLVIA